MHDIGHRGALVGMFGGQLPEEYSKGDIEGLWAKLLPRLKQLADTTDPSFFGQAVTGRALQGLGISAETLMVLRTMLKSPEMRRHIDNAAEGLDNFAKAIGSGNRR